MSNDTINGTSGYDQLYGGTGNDTIYGQDNFDDIYGGDGNDTLFGGNTDGDWLYGGDGDDILNVGNGLNDLAFGGAGDDAFSLSFGANTYYGGDGSDSFEVGYGTDTIFGGEGGTDFDTLSATRADDALTVTFTGDEAGTYVDDDGDSGAFSGIEAFELTAEADSLSGSSATSGITVDAGGGADSIVTGSGNDVLYGGAGADDMEFGFGDDLVYGGEGDDQLDDSHGFTDGSNTVYGGAGNDFVRGGSGSDTLYGGDDNDFIESDGGDDTVYGGDGADTVRSFDGNDTLFGGRGADTIEAGDDADTIVIQDGFGADQVFGGEGGTDSDTLDLSALGSGVTVSFTADEDGTFTDGTDTATFEGIENVVLSDQDDTLDARNISMNLSIDAGAGNDFIQTEGTDGSGDSNVDTIFGGTGDDTVYSGGADDTIYGGQGADTISSGFSNVGTGDTVYGGAGDDVIDSIDHNAGTNSSVGDQVYGGSGNDQIVGTAAGSQGDTLFGGKGNDSIDAQGGNDTIDGGSGNDLIYGGDGADQISGDTASASTETVSITTANYTDTSSGFSVTAQNVSGGSLTSADVSNIGTFSGGFGASGSISDTDSAVSQQTGYDKASGLSERLIVDLDEPTETASFSFEHLYTSAYAEEGHWAVYNNGSLVAEGDFSEDTFGSGSGNVDISGVGAFDQIVLTGNLQTDGSDGSDFMVTEISFERAGDSGTAGSDTLFGGAGDDTLTGGVGNDILDGGADDDLIYGGDDQDRVVLNDGFGTDTVFGGSGGTDTDTLDLSNLTGGANVTLTGDEDGTVTYGSNTTTFDDVEAFDLTEQDDVLNAGNDTTGLSVDAKGGDDFVIGGSGADTIVAGAGNDTIFFGDGEDTVYGGAGNDYFDDQAGNPGWTTANTLFGGAGKDTFWSGYGNDSIDGGTGDDNINTQWGDDTVDGGDGNDIISSEAGNASLGGGDGNDVISALSGSNTLDGGAGNDVLAGGTDGETLFGGSGADTLAGGGGGDTIYGGNDRDQIIIDDGFGSDVVYGGEGGDDSDTLDLSALGTAVTVTYTGDEAGTFTDGTDTGTFQGIENLVLTAGDDSVAGGNDVDGLSIDAGPGNDVIEGGSGADQIYGGEGNDVIDGASNGDALYGGDGDDTLKAGFGDDDFYGGTGIDTVEVDGTDVDGFAFNIDLGAGSDQYGNTYTSIENVNLGTQDDSVTGSADDNSIAGQAGDDTLDGAAGNDILDGGSGNDVLTGSAGNDTLTGGANDDTFVMTSGGGDDTVTDFASGDQLDTSKLSDVGNALTNQDGVVTADEVTVTGGGGSDQVLTFPSGETVTVPDGTIDASTPAAQFASLVAMGVPPCFATGTLILTANGEVAVEDLSPGDMIATADRGLQPLRWIGKRTEIFGDGSADHKPVEIKPGSMGKGLPRRNLVVSPQHRMVLEGPLVERAFGHRQVLAPAKALVKRKNIRRMQGKHRIDYYSLLFDRHEVIFAEGSPSESFRPGPVAMSGFEDHVKEQIYAIYPRLRAEPETGLGPAARPLVTRRQAEKMLRKERTTLIAAEPA